MDQRLRLQAELKDNASPKIRQIGKELKDIRRTPGMEQAQKWFTGFSETASGFVKDGGGVGAVMGSIGVGGLTAAASLAGLIKQFKDLADHTFAMKRLGQETGLTIDQVKRWEYVGQVFRVPVEQMDSALKTLGDQMVDFKRRRGQLFGELNQLAPELATKLGTEDTQHQLQDIFNWLGTIKNAADRNRWAKEFFGSDELGALLTNGLPALNAAIDDANKNVGNTTIEMQHQADVLNKAIIDFSASIDKLELQAGPTIIKGLSDVLAEFKTLFDNLDRLEKWWDEVKVNPGKIDKDVGKFIQDQVGLTPQQKYDRYHNQGLFEKPKDQAEADARIAALSAERDRLKADLAGDKNALGFATRHQGDITRLQDLNSAIQTLKSRMEEVAPTAKKMSFNEGGSGGLLHLASFSDGDGESTLADGVKDGVLAAFREWAAESKGVAQDGAGGKSGLTMASYEGGGIGGRSGGGRSGGGRSGAPGADTPDGSAGPVPGSMLQRGIAAMRYLVEKKGWTPEGAAIAVGNAQQESSIRGDGPAGDHGISQHMFQWNHERLAALNRFAAARGKSARDFETNLDFMDEERKHRSAVERDWDKQRDLRNAGRLSHSYEGFGDNSTATREQNARNWLNTYRKLPDLNAEARKAAGPQAGSMDGSIEAHVHIHDGHVRGATAKSSGVVKPPRVNLRRGPTMTEPNYQA